jgi:hypothetical protein
LASGSEASLQMSGFEIHLPGCATPRSRYGSDGADGMSGESRVTERDLLLMKRAKTGYRTVITRLAGRMQRVVCTNPSDENSVSYV